MEYTEYMRIQKYLSQQKILSRRETEDYIRRGWIKINGKVVKELGTRIEPGVDKIEIRPAADIKQKITIAVNKPRGIVSSKNQSEGKTIFEVLPQFSHLNTVGRLDKASEGLLLLSNDGTITSAVTGAEHLIEKEYEVSVREAIHPRKIKLMEGGIKLDDGLTLPAKAKILSQHKFVLILKEGKKHQIRRMAAAVNLTIVQLKRVRIGNISLKGIGPGQYRTLSVKEIQNLKALAKK